MNELIKMYDYLMNEYNTYVDSDYEPLFAYANSCWVIAQAYSKKIKEYC